MYLQKYKQASPTFCSLSIAGTTLNCHWLQISLSIARSHREKRYLRQLWWRKEHLPLLLTCLPATDLGNWKNKRTSFGAILLLTTWSHLNSCWLTDGPCMLLGLLTRICRYIYSHSGMYISYLLRSQYINSQQRGPTSPAMFWRHHMPYIALILVTLCPGFLLLYHKAR